MAAGTEQRILECAWRLMADRGTADVRLSDVAAAAGISRQAVYLHCGSRAGLLVAMARHADAREDLPARFRELRDQPPVDHLRGVICGWIDHIPHLAPVAMAIYGAALVGDADAVDAWNDRMDDLHAAFARAVARIDDAGLLHDRWNRRSATDWVWGQTHLTRWHQLVDDRGWPPRRAKRHLVEAVMLDVVVDG